MLASGGNRNKFICESALSGDSDRGRPWATEMDCQLLGRCWKFRPTRLEVRAQSGSGSGRFSSASVGALRRPGWALVRSPAEPICGGVQRHQQLGGDVCRNSRPDPGRLEPLAFPALTADEHDAPRRDRSWRLRVAGIESARPASKSPAGDRDILTTRPMTLGVSASAPRTPRPTRWPVFTRREWPTFRPA